MWTCHTASCNQYKDMQSKCFADLLKAKQRAAEIALAEAAVAAEEVSFIIIKIQLLCANRQLC
jgi:hypothetical protein